MNTPKAKSDVVPIVSFDELVDECEANRSRFVEETHAMLSRGSRSWLAGWRERLYLNIDWVRDTAKRPPSKDTHAKILSLTSELMRLHSEMPEPPIDGDSFVPSQQSLTWLDAEAAKLIPTSQKSLTWLDAEAAKLIPSGCAVLRRCNDDDGDVRFTAINFHRHDWIDWERESQLGAQFAVLDYRQIQS